MWWVAEELALFFRHVHTLETLAKALAPHLQQYSTGTSATWDTSVFGASADMDCLPGCSSDNGGEEEWMDFDFSAYAGAHAQPPHRRHFPNLKAFPFHLASQEFSPAKIPSCCKAQNCVSSSFILR